MINTSITKTALGKSLNFEEKYGTWNSLYNFTTKGTGVTLSLSNGIYSLSVPGGASGGGSGFYIARKQVYVPFGYSYRIAVDVYTLTARIVKYDINNYSGETSSWTGNDHDEIATRYPHAAASSSVNIFNVPATTGTTLIGGSTNSDSANTEELALDVNDSIGFITEGESARSTFQLKNFKFIVYKDSNIFSSIGKDGTTHANQIYEI